MPARTSVTPPARSGRRFLKARFGAAASGSPWCGSIRGPGIDDGRRSLDALWRIAAQAHPDKPLERGYARIEDREGRTLISAAAAREAGRLRLVFADGRIDAITGDGVEPARRRPYSTGKAEQPKLL
jgi:hypothetical protein